MLGSGGTRGGMTRTRRIAAALSLGWVALVVAYAFGFFAADPGPEFRFLDALLFLAALVLPVAQIWLVAWLAEQLAEQREIAAALAEVMAPTATALAETRTILEHHGPASPEAIGRAVQAAVRSAPAPTRDPALDRIVAGQARLEAAIGRLAASPGPTHAAVTPASPPEAAPEAPSAPTAPAAPARAAATPGPPAPLPLLPEAAAPERPSWPDLMRALDFPRDAGDRAGFAALRRALRHHGLAQLLQAAEDVLDMLSQEGVFVDEIPMEPCDPAAWRAFIAGTRGPAVAGVGGIRDERALAAARGLMRADTIFRDTALFFQRRFDTMLSDFATEASDTELADLAGTRSGRAFMLLARLSGSLD